MGKINLTIDATNTPKRWIKVDHLDGAGNVTGTDKYYLWQIARLRSEPYPTATAGWWINRITEDEFNRKIMFGDIVNYNGNPIGNTTFATIDAAIDAAIIAQAQHVT